MEEESQVYPLAPSTIYRRSDEEFAAVKPNNPHHKRSSKCLVYTLAGFVLQTAVLLVFALAVLRVETPEVTLRSVAVKNLRYVTAPSPWLNVTLVAEMSVKNNNFGEFKYENSTAAVLLYQNVTVGVADIAGGRARARKTEGLNVTMEVISNGLVTENGNFSSDLNSGLLELTSYSELIGRVRVMKIINKRMSKFMNCTMSLNLTTKAIQDLICM